jgi:hypothetical protein
MVADGTLEEIRLKANNLLKHLPCRGLRVEGITELTSETSPNVFGICIHYSIYKEMYTSTSLFKKSDLKKDLVKRCVNDFKNKIPAEFKELHVKNVKEPASEYLKSFSLENTIDEFLIVQFPYRQIKIQIGDSFFFLNVQKITWQKILARVSKEKEWPAFINFEDLLNLLKRKEIVTLCIRLTQT